MIHSEEDDEFERIAMERRLKSSGMNCCTYDCIQGRDCPVRRLKAMNESQVRAVAKEAGLEVENVPKFLRTLFTLLQDRR